jgi:hypothetical protein
MDIGAPPFFQPSMRLEDWRATAARALREKRGDRGQPVPACLRSPVRVVRRAARVPAGVQSAGERAVRAPAREGMPMRATTTWVLCLLFSATFGCGDDGAPDDAGTDARDAAADAGDASEEDAGAGPTADCDGEHVPSFAEVEIFDKCVGCHGSGVTGPARNAAPISANFDDHDSAAANAESAAQYVFIGFMPPPQTGISVSDAEKRQLYQWALCGTPE